MKRHVKILAILSAVLSVLLLLMLPFSYSPGTRHSLGFKIPPFLAFGLYNGLMMIDRRQHPYSGSDSNIRDGFAYYEGGIANARNDCDWRLGGYGFMQVRYVGQEQKLVAKDRVLILPGIFYNYLEWEQEPVLWTIGCSMWYPILLLAFQPFFFWIIQRFRSYKHNAEHIAGANADTCRE
jgi:hypothetical protein